MANSIPGIPFKISYQQLVLFDLDLFHTCCLAMDLAAVGLVPDISPPGVDS